MDDTTEPTMPEDLEPKVAGYLHRLDLSTIVLALETHERVHIERAKGNAEAPAAIAARRTRAKVRRLLEASK